MSAVRVVRQRRLSRSTASLAFRTSGTVTTNRPCRPAGAGVAGVWRLLGSCCVSRSAKVKSRVELFPLFPVCASRLGGCECLQVPENLNPKQCLESPGDYSNHGLEWRPLPARPRLLVRRNCHCKAQLAQAPRLRLRYPAFSQTPGLLI